MVRLSATDAFDPTPLGPFSGGAWTRRSGANLLTSGWPRPGGASINFPAGAL